MQTQPESLVQNNKKQHSYINDIVNHNAQPLKFLYKIYIDEYVCIYICILQKLFLYNLLYIC